MTISIRATVTNPVDSYGQKMQIDDDLKTVNSNKNVNIVLDYDKGTIGYNGKLYDMDSMGFNLNAYRTDELNEWEKKSLNRVIPNSVQNPAYYRRFTYNESDLISKLESISGGGDTITLSSSKSTKSGNTTGTSNSESLKAELKFLEAQKNANYTAINQKETEINNLIKKAEEKINEAAKNKESIIKNYQEECKQVVKEQLEEYAKANKDGNGMTKETLNSNIKSKLPNVPGLASAVSAVLEANNIASDVANKTKDLKTLITDTQNLEITIQQKQAEYESAKAVEEAQKSAAASSSNSSGSGSDPIGFNYNNETYEFIVNDKDGFNSVKDFLGAEKGWSAMQNLDTDNNKLVDASELKSNGIKLVDSKGNVNDAENIFGKNFSVNLSSYDKNGKFDGIDTGDNDKDGTVNQQLLGIFNLNVNGETIKGYNTLDDKNWLSNKYGISAGDETKKADKKAGLTLNDTLKSVFKKTISFDNSATELKEASTKENINISDAKVEMKQTKDSEAKSAIENAKPENFFFKLKK